MSATLNESLRDFEYFLKKQLEYRIKSLIPPKGMELWQAAWLSVFSGGKRLRPKLGLALAADMGWSQNHVMPALGAIELVHAYSLVHDDLPEMDNDYFRRNRPSTHAIFGPATALLVGNGLLTLAFELINDPVFYHPEESQVLSRQLAYYSGFGGLITGQYLDLRLPKKLSPELHHLNELKTAALFQLSLKWVSFLNRQSEFEVDFWAQWGKSFGLWYQKLDDYLDNEGSIDKNEILSHWQILHDQAYQKLSNHFNHLLTVLSELKEIIKQ